MTVTNVKDYVTLDTDDNYADLRYRYTDTMIAEFRQDLFHKNFSRQDQGNGDQIDTLQNRIKLWLNNIERGVPIPDNIYDYNYNDDGLDSSVRGAGIFPAIRED